MHCSVPHGCGANHTIDKEAVHFITSLGTNLPALETSLQVWQPAGSTSIKWFRHSLLDQDVDVISDMVRGRFFPGSGILFEPKATQFCVLNGLLDEGVVDKVGDGWRLTLAGMKSLNFASDFRAPTQVFAIRPDCPILDSTCYELVLRLEGKGFCWQRLPVRVQAR